MSVLEIMVMLHVHAIAEPWPRPSPAYDKAIERFLRRGLIRADQESPSGYRTTWFGDTYVNLLMGLAPCGP